MEPILISPGHFSDQGFRYRRNTFRKHDSWVPGIPGSMSNFYDIQFYNSLTVPVEKDYLKIMESYFRIDGEEIVHSRNVYRLMDWLGAIGGVERILMNFTIFIFGSYSKFNSTIELINQVNTQNQKGQQDKASGDDDATQPSSEILQSCGSRF